MRRCCAIAIAALSVVMIGCGGGFAAGRPWDAAMEATVFDDGIDVVDNPAKLSGEWAFRARRDLEARSNLADMVAVVTIMSVQTMRDVDSNEARRVDARVEKALYGSSPNNNLVLKSSASALGNALLMRHEGRLTGSYLVFLRWFEQEDGTIGHHFHLSPSSPEISEQVRKYVRARVAKEAANE